jgi:Fanconi-associated nuclease 1
MVINVLGKIVANYCILSRSTSSDGPGKCVRVNKELFEIFRRINLIYFRKYVVSRLYAVSYLILFDYISTQHTPTLLTPSILSRSNKRFYPKYTYFRRTDIWPTREALIAYEEALALEARVDGILEATGILGTRGRSRSVASKTPGPRSTSSSVSRQFKIPCTPASALKGKGKDKENLSMEDDVGMDLDEDIKVETPKVQDARLIKEIFEAVFPRWKALLEIKEEEGRPCALERFHCGLFHFIPFEKQALIFGAL